jgi:hypothetical protein
VVHSELRPVHDTQDTHPGVDSTAIEEVDMWEADIDIDSRGVDTGLRHYYNILYRTNGLFDASKSVSTLTWRGLRRVSSRRDIARDVVRSSNVVGHVSNYN